MWCSCIVNVIDKDYWFFFILKNYVYLLNGGIGGLFMFIYVVYKLSWSIFWVEVGGWGLIEDFVFLGLVDYVCFFSGLGIFLIVGEWMGFFFCIELLYVV